MPDLILQFPRADYPSLQVGDIAYYVDTETTGGFTVNDNDTDLTLMGNVRAINHSTSLDDGTLTTSITVFIGDNVPAPNANNFVFFKKNNVNLTSLLGYYGSCKFVNDSNLEAELYSTGCEISESSK